MKQKIIIDCDPGIDDAMALVYAVASDKFDILAVHTVAGNVNVDYTTSNARAVMGFLNAHDIPVCQGSNIPLVVKPTFADDIHGVNGMGGYEFDPDVSAPLSEKTALESYVDILENTEDKVTIVAIGPLTNLAILLRAYPHLTDKIEQIAIMGGGIKGGNITSAAEFNFYVDPHAAHVVMHSGLPIILAGLDVTEEARLFEEDLKEIQSLNSKLGSWMLEVNSVSIGVYDSLGYGRSCTPNDVVPLMYLVRPDIFEVADMTIDVSYSEDTRGMTYVDRRIRLPLAPNSKVIMAVNKDAFREEYKESIEHYVKNTFNH